MAVSPRLSIVTASPERGVFADGRSSAAIAIRVRDLAGDAVAARPVRLAAVGEGAVLTQPGPTDAQGLATGQVASTEPGVLAVTVTVDPDGEAVVLAQQPEVEFILDPEAPSDEVLGVYRIFEGVHVTAPTVLHTGTFQMWYGGRQDGGEGSPEGLHYRTSSDGVAWSGHMTVLTSAEVGPAFAWVGDPSVLKRLDPASARWQYVLFYTAALQPGGGGSQVWSAVSANGLTWKDHRVLLDTPAGAAAPAALLDPGPEGRAFRVYFVERADPRRVRMAWADEGRSPLGDLGVQVVYTHPGPESIGDPEVRPMNGRWQLFFSLATGSGVDVAKVESGSPDSFEGGEVQVVVRNEGSDLCATLGPGVLPREGANYDLYAGLVSRESGCDLSRAGAMQRWRLQDR
ncbi:MAG: Ig-like domain-containing protein [Planctomycetes bacterium]|nr:Ig-like domain-containing protein [Planctomycetota bacterium]